MQQKRKYNYETFAIDFDIVKPHLFGSSTVGFDLLRIAHENGGFLAGGFARQLVRLSQNNKMTPREKSYELKQYLGYADHGRFAKTGDVDVFFFNHKGRERTLKWIVDNAACSPPMLATDSLTGNAKTIMIEGIRFQLINIVTGTPDQVIDTFDICNAMVAVRDKRAMQIVGRSDLDANGIIEVDNWNTPYTICRVAKYIGRLRNERDKTSFVGLHPRTAAELMNVASDLVVKLKNNPIMYPNDKNVKFTEQHVISSLRLLVPWIPTADLVLLAAYFYRDRKNIAVEELLKRGNVPKLLVANWSDY